MLTRILQEAISKQANRKLLAIPRCHFSQVRIMDSTEFVVSKKVADTFPGYGGQGREAIVQVQLEYELLGGKVTELSIGSALDADSTEGMKNIGRIPERALLMRDLAYFSPKAFRELAKMNLFFISRAKTQWSFFVKENGSLTKLTTKDIIEKLKTQKEKYVDMEVIVGDQARTPVRLIANLLTEEQADKRVKKKKANGSLSKHAEENACLNLFVTNVGKEQCSAAEIYQLYRLRWQVELVFKTWKSILSVHKTHSMNATRLECQLLVKLLWVVLNWSILKLAEETTKREMSLHKFTRTLMARSKGLDMALFQDKERLMGWVHKLISISMFHHKKEYRKSLDELPINILKRCKSAI